MKLFIAACLLAVSLAQTDQTVLIPGNCEAHLEENCEGQVGDDGGPCRWHFGDQSCKEDTGEGIEGYAPVAPCEGSGCTVITPVFENDGCEEFADETTCTGQVGENGENCHWVLGEGCKKSDCEHFLSSETCTGKTGEHGRACVWLLDEGCEETPGVDGGDPLEPLEHEGCEAYDSTTCSGNVGENGVACHWYESECKESNCEHYITEAECNVATSEDNETCSWNLGDGCKEASDPTEPHCDYYTEAECNAQTGENGKQCYWDPTENGGYGQCDEDNSTEINEYEAPELPGLLRKANTANQSSKGPASWLFVAAPLVLFVVTAGITNHCLRKQAAVEDIDMSYRAVV